MVARSVGESLSSFAKPLSKSVVISECPKCGIVCEDDSISVSSEQVYDAKEKKWTESKRTIRATILTTYVKLPTTSKCLCQRSDEHLHRKCLVCGFYWSTETMDDYFETNSGRIDRTVLENE